MRSFACRAEQHGLCDGGTLGTGVGPIVERRCECSCHQEAYWESHLDKYSRQIRLTEHKPETLYPVIIYGRDRKPSDPSHYIFRDQTPMTGRTRPGEHRR